MHWHAYRYCTKKILDPIPLRCLVLLGVFCLKNLFFIPSRMLEENLPFQQKLHIVYLTNDLLHHSRKKEMPQIQDGLEPFVLPVIAMTFHDATAEQQAKLVKVLNIWNTQSFFKEETREVS